MTAQLSLIAAIAHDRVIGRDGDLPWRLSSDLRRFKTLTRGHPIIMGRRTHESIGRALPGRLNLVLSRTVRERPGVTVLPDLETALERAQGESDLVFVIGGSAVYAAALDKATRLDLTWVDARVSGDAFFPKFDVDAWKVVEELAVPANDADEYDSVYRRYERRAQVGESPGR
ncbi:MAG: dihydrofolate reductase [Acidobacteriota bacterium]